MNDEVLPPAYPSGLTDIISPEEIDKFYELLPKIQQANFFLESINANNVDEPKNEKRLSPYIVELDINCKVLESPSTALAAPIMVHENKKTFVIDFVISDYESFIDTFYNHITNSLQQTCHEIFKSGNADERTEN